MITAKQKIKLLKCTSKIQLEIEKLKIYIQTDSKPPLKLPADQEINTQIHDLNAMLYNLNYSITSKPHD